MNMVADTVVMTGEVVETEEVVVETEGQAVAEEETEEINYYKLAQREA